MTMKYGIQISHSRLVLVEFSFDILFLWSFFGIPSSCNNEPLNWESKSDWQEIQYRYNLEEIPYLRKWILGVCLKSYKLVRERKVGRIIMEYIASFQCRFDHPHCCYTAPSIPNETVSLAKSKHSFACM